MSVRGGRVCVLKEDVYDYERSLRGGERGGRAGVEDEEEYVWSMRMRRKSRCGG